MTKEWSKSINMLQGRIIKIEGKDKPSLTLELRNSGGSEVYVYIGKDSIRTFIKSEDKMYFELENIGLSLPYDPSKMRRASPNQDFVWLQPNERVQVQVSLSISYIYLSEENTTIFAEMTTCGNRKGKLIVEYFSSHRYWDNYKQKTFKAHKAWKGKIILEEDVPLLVCRMDPTKED
ncbi:hypothetical protein ACFL54_07565 [Planctomycetota bacterium]